MSFLSIVVIIFGQNSVLCYSLTRTAGVTCVMEYGLSLSGGVGVLLVVTH